MKFEEAKAIFDKETSADTGHKIMARASELIAELGRDFLAADGEMLSSSQMKLAGYKFFLADYIGDINRISEGLKIDIKNVRAKEWEIVSEEIKARDGRVKNKEQIENIIFEKTESLMYSQILHETLFYKFKLKISSIDSILTAITQRLSELKRQLGQQ